MKLQNKNEYYKIIKATTPQDFEVIKELFIEYQKELGKDLTFQSFDDELQNLSKKYNEANGALLLLKDVEDKQFVGCVGVKVFKENVCEMKRLYVKPEYRSKKYGLQLVHAILSMAVELGYKEMWLDTLEELRAAISLYRRLGFIETEPYYDNPYKDVVFMRKKLNKKDELL